MADPTAAGHPPSAADDEDTVKDAPAVQHQSVDGQSDAPAAASGDASAVAGAAEEDSDDDDTVTERYTIMEDLYNELLAAGFTPNSIKKSIVGGCVDFKTCRTWIEMQLDHPELHTDLEPHIKVKIRQKRVLTDEEREAKVAELKAKIAQKKIDDAEAEKQRETEMAKKRMADGKAALHAKEEREALQRKLDYEQRRKEKEQDRLAKEKLHKELAVDRLKRSGMDETAARVQVEKEFEEKRKELEAEKRHRAEVAKQERERMEREGTRKDDGPSSGGGGGWDLSKLVGPSESELGEKQQAAASGPAAAAASSGIVVDFDRDHSVVVWPSAADFTAILVKSTESVPATDPRSVNGRTILRKVLDSVVQQPMEKRVRTLKVTSGTFTGKIYPMPLACLYLRQAGFQEAASSQALEQAGAHDQLTMHACILPKVRAAIEALDAFAASSGC